MIYDVLLTLDQELRDAGTGLNARIAAVNAAKGTAAPTMGEINTWDLKHPSEYGAFPVLQQLFTAGSDLQLKSQAKWRGDFGISWEFWLHHGQQAAGGDALKWFALWAHAARELIDELPEKGTIQEVQDVGIGIQLREANHIYAVMTVGFTVKERDEL